MHYFPEKSLKYSVLFLCLLMFLKICVSMRQDDDNTTSIKLMKVSKRNILSREFEYLKSKPLSNEMRSFIKRFKRRSKNRQYKRQKEIDKENMYVVQNGEIIPLSNVEKDLEDDKPLRDNFTVIPLIIPVSVPRDEGTSTSETPLFRDNREDFTPETTANTEIDIKEIEKEAIKENLTTRKGHHKSTTDIICETTEKGADSSDEESENKEHDKSTLKPVDPKLLNKVLLDVQELVSSDNESKLKAQESASCKVEGDWDSIAGGMEFRIEFRNDSHRPDILLVDRDPPMDEGFLNGQNWSVSAFMPFTKSSIFVITAHTIRGKKMVALFTGECRVCEGEETIVGNWLLQRHSKDCKDRQVSHRFISDVFKKNNVRELQAQHLHEVEISITTNSG